MIDNSPQHYFLLKLKHTKYPTLNVRAVTNTTSFKLLDLVQNRSIKFASISSLHYNLKNNYFSHTSQVNLPNSQYSIGFAFPKTNDFSFINETNSYLKSLAKTKKLTTKIAKYISNPEHRVSFSTSITFKRKLEKTLPKYQTLIQETAAKYGVDWLLLAAIAYQESRWNPNARSYTNVRGFMMLTQTTARQMGIKNRLDINNSLDGGTRYFLKLYNRFFKKNSQKRSHKFCIGFL